MNLSRCKKGHYYDGDKYVSCPHCAQKDIPARNTVRMVDNVDTKQTEPQSKLQGKALKDAVLDALEKKRESEVEQFSRKKLVDGVRYPVGILVEVNGNGAGTIHRLEMGCNYIGMKECDMVVSQDKEQLTETNASLSYRKEHNMFVLKPIGDTLTVQVGRMLLRENIMLRAYDKVRINETILLFVPICGEHFDWE